METGRKIMNLRKDRGVAQSSLAEMTSVTPSALSRIEAGIHQPRGSVALRIARELGVTVDYILDGEAPYPPPPMALLENLTENPAQQPRDQEHKSESWREEASQGTQRADYRGTTITEDDSGDQQQRGETGPLCSGS